MTATIHRSALRDIDAATLYGVMRLRLQVFVVEQRAAYEDLDGRDLEPGAELLWASEGARVVSTVRILHEPDGVLRIGRVATDPGARGRGLAAELMRRAVRRCVELDPAAPIVLGAQAHLADWYARFGFVIDGPPYAEDDIPHVPMRRTA
ncbi:GNAT family N-acetyltransferase [Actinotalea sp.]|uniref:GNAT family N-acetyltransferase n=1 Tax=Actinotalea sp. TaxID=1872145 RepID=UPI003561CD8B